MSICLMTGDANFDHSVKVVSAYFPYGEVMIFLFVIDKDTLRLC